MFGVVWNLKPCSVPFFLIAHLFWPASIPSSVPDSCHASSYNLCFFFWGIHQLTVCLTIMFFLTNSSSDYQVVLGPVGMHLSDFVQL